MKKFYKWSLLPLFLLLGSANVWAQSTTISGTVKDATGDPIPGVNIVVKGTVTGTITDVKGQYNISVKQAPPFTLSFSFIGYQTQEVEVKDASATSFDIAMEVENRLGEEIVVTGTRWPETLLKSGVTMHRVDILDIKQAPTPDFYDGLANLPGVQASSGSLNFTAINTRSFATIANVRFVQWVDGMDTQAPLLNFPTGNIIGIGELDAESMELIPGASSALYGPNAFNGILIMKSKSPFEYQGLSAQVKYGITKQSNVPSNPLTQYSIRYAKSFNNKFAFKVNASIMQAKDWLGNDYKTDRVNPESKTLLSGNTNFDGLNLYGDETQINLAGVLPSLGVVTRTGFKEEDLVDDREAKSIKFDGALHYRITDKIEAIANYRFGGGSSIYQGTEKYALRDFTQQFMKLELRGDNFFIRGYQTATDAGKSYNLSALGGFMNETVSPSSTNWVPDYLLAMQGYIPTVPGGNPAAARAFADRNRPTPGSPQFTNLVNAVKANYFQKTPTGNWLDSQPTPGSHPVAGGASFIDNSKLLHLEANYQFKNMIKWADVQVGGNFRQYDLFSNGTIFNEAPDDGVNFQRIKINEFGVYGVVAKTIAEKLRATASLRYDKNENFNGQVTPRLTLVYEVAQDNNIRASFQTGFRNPDTQAQFIYFPSSGGTLVGSTERNASRYGIHNGGAWTQASYNDFVKAGGSLDPATGTPINPASNPTASNVLKTANVAYVQPEKLVSGELGYKGLFMVKRLLVDLSGFYTNYTGFIGGQIVASKNPVVHQGKTSNPGSLYSPYVNSLRDVTSFGIGFDFALKLPSNFELNGNYNYANYTATEDKDFRAGFNTPKNRGSIGLSNRNIFENFGASINYRYQTAFLWESSYGTWNVPEFGVLDAQVSYKVSSIKSVFKLGATNLGGGDYRTNLGAPYVGQQYYLSITFDEFLK